MRASVSDHGSPTPLDRRAALRLLSGAALASAAGIAPTRNARAQTLVPIQIGIQIFTGAVATVWAEKKLYEKHRLTVEAKQMADGRTVRDAMVPALSWPATMASRTVRPSAICLASTLSRCFS